MPGKTGANDFVVHALLGRLDLDKTLGPLKRADDDFVGDSANPGMNAWAREKSRDVINPRSTFRQALSTVFSGCLGAVRAPIQSVASVVFFRFVFRSRSYRKNA
jgi:hypothetical protein